MLVEINLKVRYRQTIIGFLWVILNPIVLYIVQSYLFSQILHKSDSSYYFYLLSGLLPWFYLSQTAEMGCNYINSNSGLIKDLRIHPFKLVASLAIENYINMLCASIIIFFFIFINFNESASSFLFYIVASLWIVLLTTLITFISSLLNVLFKDTKFILHFIFTILYFTTPTFFYTENLPYDMQTLLKYNPFYWIIGIFRVRDFSLETIYLVLINLAIMLTLSFMSWIIWKKLKNKIYLKL